jgi:hypothetical protein
MCLKLQKLSCSLNKNNNSNNDDDDDYVNNDNDDKKKTTIIWLSCDLTSWPCACEYTMPTHELYWPLLLDYKFPFFKQDINNTTFVDVESSCNRKIGFMSSYTSKKYFCAWGGIAKVYCEMSKGGKMKRFHTLLLHIYLLTPLTL